MYFTGSNLFGQWIGCHSPVIDKFITMLGDKQVYSNFDVKAATLVYIGWSHNIFYFNNQFYIVGDYTSSGQYLEQINVPEECLCNSDLTIVSDDNRLVFFNRDACKFCVVNLESKEVKTLNLTTEVPIENISKRAKKEDYIIKCVATNSSLMFITSKSLVYNGFIPSLMDTSHCVGEPIDIQSGNEHYMLLTSTGRIYTWGNGR